MASIRQKARKKGCSKWKIANSRKILAKKSKKNGWLQKVSDALEFCKSNRLPGVRRARIRVGFDRPSVIGPTEVLREMHKRAKKATKKALPSRKTVETMMKSFNCNAIPVPKEANTQDLSPTCWESHRGFFS